MKKIGCTGWLLHNTSGNHNKFYQVVVTDNGVVITNWGRIGTDGQCSVQSLNYEQANAIGLRQVYSKQASGYDMQVDKFEFTAHEDEIQAAVTHDDGLIVMYAFETARLRPRYEHDRAMVIKHYDEFVARAQALMEQATQRPMEEVFDELGQLETAWSAIMDKHDEAEVTISLTKQMLNQRLMA